MVLIEQRGLTDIKDSFKISWPTVASSISTNFSDKRALFYESPFFLNYEHACVILLLTNLRLGCFASLQHLSHSLLLWCVFPALALLVSAHQLRPVPQSLYSVITSSLLSAGRFYPRLVLRNLEPASLAQAPRFLVARSFPSGWRVQMLPRKKETMLSKN